MRKKLLALLLSLVCVLTLFGAPAAARGACRKGGFSRWPS